MLRVRTDYVDGEIGSPIILSCCKLLNFQCMSGKFKVKLEGKSGKNNIHRVPFPIQICQIWGTAYDTDAAAGRQRRGGLGPWLQAPSGVTGCRTVVGRRSATAGLLGAPSGRNNNNNNNNRCTA